MNILQAKSFDFTNVKYMSYSQLNQHYILYTRYVDTINKVKKSLMDNSTYKNCSQNYSDIRCAQKALSFNLDGVKLHELYFENMSGLNTTPSQDSLELITNHYGNYEGFKDKFKCIGLSVKGWVILCYDEYTGEYIISGVDSHDEGVILQTYPIIVMDVWEHAYMIDFGIDRGMYIDIFFENLDFSIINDRLKRIKNLDK